MGDPPDAPLRFAPLPDRPPDGVAAFEARLAEMLELLGGTMPPPGPARGRLPAARQAVVAALRPPARPEWFGPLVRTAVYDIDPSANARLVEAAVRLFGYRRVQEALLGYLRSGTNPERAGAANAWYWAVGRFRGVEESPWYEGVAEVHRQWRETSLRVFVDNPDLDVRRCILPGLSLHPGSYSRELRPLVDRAVHIARTSDDPYLRHRVEIQLG